MKSFNNGNLAFLFVLVIFLTVFTSKSEAVVLKWEMPANAD
jgi:hypothetical protein